MNVDTVEFPTRREDVDMEECEGDDSSKEKSVCGQVWVDVDTVEFPTERECGCGYERVHRRSPMTLTFCDKTAAAVVATLFYTFI